MRMLRSFAAASIALCATSALAGTFPSPPLYPSFSQAKAQFITIDPPGATQAFAVALNPKGEVAGYYGTKNFDYRGFIRKANGTFLIFPVLEGNTIVSAMDEGGDVIGAYFDGTRGFVRKAHGTVIKFDVPNSSGTVPSAINNNGEIAGTFFDTDSQQHGFLRASSGTITVVDAPDGSCGTNLYGINLAGAAVGRACAGNGGTDHAFVRDSQGNFTTIDPPGATSASANAINASGTIAGTFTDSKNLLHSFIRDPSGSFAIVDPPHPDGSNTAAYITGLNKAGGTVGCYDGHKPFNRLCFIRSAAGVFTKFRVPGAFGTYPARIDATRQVVGYYVTSENGKPHAFLRTH